MNYQKKYNITGFCFVLFLLGIIIYLIVDKELFETSNVISVIFIVFISFGLIFGGVLFLISILLKKGKAYSFTINHGFTRMHLPEELKIKLKNESFLFKANDNFCFDSDCYGTRINNVDYYLVPGTYSSGVLNKSLRYEFIFFIKHNRSSLPKFRLSANNYIFDHKINGNDGICLQFPEDKEFTYKYDLQELNEIHNDTTKDEIINFFTNRVRKLFLKNYVRSTIFYNISNNEFYVVCYDSLSEFDKEKIFIITDTLFGWKK